MNGNVGTITEKASFKNIKVSEILSYTLLKKEINEVIEHKKDKEIIFENNQENRESNIYALLTIIDISKNYLHILVESIESSIYSDPDIINALANWMNEDNNRTITLILKEKSTEEKLLFECLFYLVNINPFKRIKVKLTKDKTLKNCNINCLIGDNHIYKIDKNNKSDNKSNEKYIVINYFNKNKSTDILNTLGFSKNMSREVKN